MAIDLFSTRGGTEAISRGTANEDAVTLYLLGYQSVQYISTVGILSKESEGSFDANPHIIAVLDLSGVAEAGNIEKYIADNGVTFSLATVKIETQMSA